MTADPALLFEKKDHQGPGTHVLLIGIGTYDYLLGGEKEDEDMADGMEQLEAPPQSVKAIADWFLDEHFSNQDRPLASLAIIVSAAAPYVHVHAAVTNGGTPLPRGSAAEVVAAIRAWALRASIDKDNQTIFYFCGHGTFTGNPMLLCRDYGSQPLDRFDGALNFGGLCRGMEYLTPGYQLFLADACRTPDAIPDMLSGLPNAGHSAITPPSLNAGIPKPARQSVHFATSKLKPSYGKVGGMSFYADALLRALAGGGAQNEFDMWVGTSGLQNALETYCIRQASEFGLEQEPDRIRNGRFAIHKPAKVEVPVYMTCDPDEALANKFSLTATRGTQVAMSLDHNPGTPPRRYIDFLLEPDKYEVSATFDATTPFVGGEKKDLMVFPPETPLCLAIARRTP